MLSARRGVVVSSFVLECCKRFRHSDNSSIQNSRPLLCRHASASAFTGAVAARGAAMSKDEPAPRARFIYQNPTHKLIVRKVRR
jgi:hypothetical protein